MTDAFVVPDAHGNAALVRGLLEQEGIIELDDHDVRRIRGPEDAHVVQLGDLANCVASSAHDDLQALELVHSGLIDTMLVGNHEHPYFGGPAFHGYFPDSQVRNSLYMIRNRGDLKAAHAVGDVLITHAGLTPWALRRLAPGLSAGAIAMTINGIWKTSPRDPIFSVIGKSRGGYSNESGILWADWSEPKLRKLRQLMGHTVGDRIRHRNAATCIDLGGGKGSTRIAGAWIRDGEIQTVIYAGPLPGIGVAA